MRVVFCWSDISGYMAASWQALAVEGVDVSVVAFAPAAVGVAPFAPTILGSLPHRLLDENERFDADLVARTVVEFKPDVIVNVGWFHGPYRALLDRAELAGVKFVMGMDTPWRGLFKQRLARLKIGPYVDRLDAVVVAGERAWQYAKRLKVGERKIWRGVYAADYASFLPAMAARQGEESGWPRRFLFVGRFEEQKGIPTLVEGYRAYRKLVQDPWPLAACGRGPLEGLLRGQEGIDILGFVQPKDQPEVFARAGAFVLASHYEPWGVVVAEAMASGMPVICTEACSAAVELVRPFFNGLLFATGDSHHLASRLRWAHEHHDRLPEMGRRAQQFAQAHSCQAWAVRWKEMFLELTADARP